MTTPIPVAACIVGGCGRAGSPQNDAGLHLGLCTRHLNALRAMCRKKHQLAYPKLAVNEARRLTRLNLGKPGREVNAYLCTLAGHWHVGNRRDSGERRCANEAATAVRRTLNPAQLNGLVGAWRK